MANCGFNRDIAEGVIRSGAADLVAFGRIYMRWAGPASSAERLLRSQWRRDSSFGFNLTTTRLRCPPRSNPDLAERFASDAPLAPPADMSVWYTPDPKVPEKGYIDFPTAAESKVAAAR